MKLPEAAGLIFCDQVAIDPISRQFNLAGLFQTLRFKEFPTPPRPFTVYAALYDGVGEGTMELTCMRLETERDIYRFQRWVHFPGRQYWMNLEIPLKKCVFPAPGRYEFVLKFDSQKIAGRYLDVYKIGE